MACDIVGVHRVRLLVGWQVGQVDVQEGTAMEENVTPEKVFTRPECIHVARHKCTLI